MTDEWTPAAARERLAQWLLLEAQKYINLTDPSLAEVVQFRRVALPSVPLLDDLMHALDYIVELESLLAERERAVAEQAAWGLAMETERNQVQRLYDAQSAEIAALRAALVFYADPEHYEDIAGQGALDSSIAVDMGERARAALHPQPEGE